MSDRGTFHNFKPPVSHRCGTFDDVPCGICGPELERIRAEAFEAGRRAGRLEGLEEARREAIGHQLQGHPDDCRCEDRCEHATEIAEAIAALAGTSQTEGGG